MVWLLKLFDLQNMSQDRIFLWSVLRFLSQYSMQKWLISARDKVTRHEIYSMHKPFTVCQTFRFLYLKFTVYGTMLYLQAGWTRVLFLVCNFYCSLLLIVKEIHCIVPGPKVVLAIRDLCYWSSKLSSFCISFTKEVTLCSNAEQMEHCFREEILIQKGFQISLHWTDKRNTFTPLLHDNIIVILCTQRKSTQS